MVIPWALLVFIVIFRSRQYYQLFMVLDKKMQFFWMGNNMRCTTVLNILLLLFIQIC